MKQAVKRTSSEYKLQILIDRDFQDSPMKKPVCSHANRLFDITEGE